MPKKNTFFILAFFVFLCLSVLAFFVNSSNNNINKNNDAYIKNENLFKTNNSLSSLNMDTSEINISSSTPKKIPSPQINQDSSRDKNNENDQKNSSLDTPSSTPNKAHENSISNGKIVGQLTFPAEEIVEVNACAENITTSKTVCSPRKSGVDLNFEIEVEPGDYKVYSTSTVLENYKAYYDEQVLCSGGFPTTVCSAKYPESKPILVTVKQSESVEVMPWNWYRAQ